MGDGLTGCHEKVSPGDQARGLPKEGLVEVSSPVREAQALAG